MHHMIIFLGALILLPNELKFTHLVCAWVINHRDGIPDVIILTSAFYRDTNISLSLLDMTCPIHSKTYLAFSVASPYSQFIAHQ